MIPALKRSISAKLSPHITTHSDHSLRRLLLRTVSAQLHSLGFLLALGFSTTLLMAIYQQSPGLDRIHWISAVIFGLTGLMVFASSSLLHFLADGFQISIGFFRLLRFLDHASIYLFIAGCYTVFVINTIQAPWNSIILTIVWSTAILGLVYTALKSRLPKLLRSRWVSTGLFLALGWTILIRLPEAWQALETAERGLLVIGGFFYTAGAAVYASRQPNPYPKIFGFHEIWHLAVLLGYVSHSAMVLSFYK